MYVSICIYNMLPRCMCVCMHGRRSRGDESPLEFVRVRTFFEFAISPSLPLHSPPPLSRPDITRNRRACMYVYMYVMYRSVCMYARMYVGPMYVSMRMYVMCVLNDVQGRIQEFWKGGVPPPMKVWKVRKKMKRFSAGRRCIKRSKI